MSESLQVCSTTTGGAKLARPVYHQTCLVRGSVRGPSQGWLCVRQRGSVSISRTLALGSVFLEGLGVQQKIGVYIRMDYSFVKKHYFNKVVFRSGKIKAGTEKDKA